jgi:hypothetical protein
MKSKIAKCAMLAAIAAASLVLASCKSSLVGTYTSPNDPVMLELRSGGKAVFTFMGNTADCTYKSSSSQLTLNCPGTMGTMLWTIHDDGSLTGPPGTFVPPLQKSKK